MSDPVFIMFLFALAIFVLVIAAPSPPSYPEN